MAPKNPIPRRDAAIPNPGGAPRRPFFEPQDKPVMVTIAIGVMSLGAALLMGWRP